MTKPYHLCLLVFLLVDGGTVAPPTRPEHPDGGPTGSAPGSPDAGILPFSSSHTVLEGGTVALDGGAVAAPPLPAVTDAGTLSALPGRAQAIKWPEDLQPLATLDGPAILAANAALQRVLERFPKEHKRSCAYSARAMEVLVGEQEGLYFVRINWRLDKCGRAPPGFNPAFDWFELYAVSPDGKILERYPYHP